MLTLSLISGYHSSKRCGSRTWRRRHQTHPGRSDDLMGTAGEKLESMPEADPNGCILAALQSLPLRWQQILWYAEVQNEPIHQIATLMGIKPNGVLSVLRRARAALRTGYVQIEPAVTPEEAEQIHAHELAGVRISPAGASTS